MFFEVGLRYRGGGHPVQAEALSCRRDGQQRRVLMCPGLYGAAPPAQIYEKFLRPRVIRP